MRRLLISVLVLVLAVAAAAATGLFTDRLAALGAGGLLHPMRGRAAQSAPEHCTDEVFAGFDVNLVGWRCEGIGVRRGTVIYLHGVADTRISAVDVIQRFVRQGFDVVAYDSRAHGSSTGEFCTYGFYEKEDLRRAIDTVAPGPLVLVGSSLGAAVALQHAARDPRVTAVIAAETFSDLRTIGTERGGRFFTESIIVRAFELAERKARFLVDDVSPVRAAASITAPVLLVHGADDVDTPPAHSQRVLAALKGTKRLILVPGAGHNQSLRPDVWQAIDTWLADVVRRQD